MPSTGMATVAAEPPKPAEASGYRPTAPATGDIHAELLVLGSGPGGYTAAFRGADLGLQTVLVERNPTLGAFASTSAASRPRRCCTPPRSSPRPRRWRIRGQVGKPEVDVDALRGWKESVVKKLTGGLGLAKGRKVQVVEGVGQFAGPNLLSVETGNGRKTISFDQCIPSRRDRSP